MGYAANGIFELDCSAGKIFGKRFSVVNFARTESKRSRWF